MVFYSRYYIHEILLVFFTFLALAAVLILTVPFVSRSLAQDQEQEYDQDPPGRAGRIGYVQGTVSFQPGGEGDWLDAVPNRPLTTGDNLWADRDSRAEVQIGSTSVRLAPETSLTFLDLEDNVTQLRVSVGSVFLRVRNLDRDDLDSSLRSRRLDGLFGGHHSDCAISRRGHPTF